MRETRQHLASLERDDPQPSLPMEADVTLDKKTRNRMDYVEEDRAISGDSSPAQVDLDPICLTRFHQTSGSSLFKE